MNNKLDIGCRCMTVKGHATNFDAKNQPRMVCYCIDCQAFARFLKNPEIMDKNGGSEVIPFTPKNIQITQGKENIECVRLSDKGMFRYYAGCCNTPIGNSMPSEKVPFIGISKTFIRSDKEVLGPVFARVMGKDGYGILPDGAHLDFPKSLLLKHLKFFFLGFITRQHTPYPFDRKNVKTHIMTLEERNLYSGRS